MDEQAKVAALRAELPVTDNLVYLNTGSVGPLPRRTVAAMAAASERELREGRIGAAAIRVGREAEARVRRAVAAVVGASEEEIALTHYTTEGVNIAVWGLDWRPGDEIVITNLEHSGVFLPVWAVQQRFGVTVRIAELGFGEGDAVAAFAGLIGPRTRLVVFSHVAYCTGAMLPAKEIVALAHERGALALIDGAQSVGAIPVDVKDLDVDFYAMPGQKWLCGPEDTGALYVRRERLDTLQQTYVGYRSMARYAFDAPYLPLPDARRFEVGSRHVPSLVGQATSTEWIIEEVGLDWACTRIRRLLARARAGLAEVPGVRVLTPANAAGLLSFTVEGIDPDTVVSRLDAQRIIIRSIKVPNCARAAFGFYATEEDVDRFVAAVSAIAARS